MNTIRSVCVYCGSSPGRDEIYAKAGHLLGRSLAKSGLRLVYGGGTKGIMGAVAEGALKAGGKVTGIIPRFLINKEATETALDRLDELLITDNMHERKHKMFEKSDAFVALPGGIGTVEEIVEVMTWGQLGHHRKPILIANIDGYWTPLLRLFDQMRDLGFISSSMNIHFHVADRVEDIIPMLRAAVKSLPAGAGDAAGINGAEISGV